jgi:hyperosmotically inducible periplasmic protein
MLISLKRITIAVTVALWNIAAHTQAEAADLAASASLSASTPAAGSESAAQRKVADRQLKRRVIAALARTHDLDATRILVRAHDGTVTLAGSVADTSQVNLAAATASRVAGVVSVSNQLRIDSRPL